MATKRKSTKKFNWQGITENGDGTFTTVGKREKRRVLKALHEQGVAVRSKQNTDGTWTVTPVGSVRIKAQPRTVSPAPSPYREPGHRINTRESGFPKYPRGGAGRPTPRGGGRPFPGSTGGPVYHGGPRASGPSPLTVIGNKAGEYLRERQRKKQAEQDRKQEIKKLSEEMEEKWNKEEMTTHPNKMVAEAHKQHEERSKKYAEESLDQRIKTMEENRRQKEAEQRREESLRRQQFKQEARKPGEAEQYRINEITKRQQEQRQQRQESRMNQGGYTGGSTRAPEIPKQKVDPATLQHARESAVKGED